MNVLVWPDNETAEDLLGFRVHADLVRSVITDPSLLPVTIGVFGDWGGGKSSIMRMLEKDFSSDAQYKDIACLYFNGWQFEGYEDAKTALLASILVQLGEHKTFGNEVKGKVVGLLKRVKLMEVAKVGLKHGMPLAATYLTGGIAPALQQLGLGHLVGSTPSEVTAALLDALAGPASTLDQAAAREAVADLNDELFGEAETFEDMDQLLKAALDEQGLGALLQRFFGHYLFVRFCRDFYERWERLVGAAQASSSLDSVKDFIETSLRSNLVGRDSVVVNWFGAEGLRLADHIMRQTLTVFEVPA